MKKIKILILCLLSAVLTDAQIESTKWLLSNNNVIDFNSQISVSAHPDTIIPHREGATMVMDKLGNILFSVTGTAVYDKDWNFIKNGNGLTENTTINSAQSPVVLQKPGSETEYYVFYTEDHSIDETEGDLKYSIVNICDEDGKLSIAPLDKNVKIEGNFSERLHLVEIDKNNYWLLTTSLFEKTLLAFKITENGISNTPVESYIDSRFDGQIGKIVVSNDKRKLAWSSTFTNTSGISIFDFDLMTGKISNEEKIHEGEIYGIEWSLSDSYIYYTDIFSGCAVYSYSFETGTNTQLFSRFGNYQVGDLKLSPFKDRIIVAQSYNNKLAEIVDLENGGQYSEIDIEFQGELDMSLGLQQQLIHYGFDLPSIDFTEEDLIIMEGEDFTQLSISDVFTNVSWSDGQVGGSATFYEEGVYQVKAFYNCQLVEREFEIIKETIFEQECTNSFDGSSLSEGLLLNVDFVEPLADNSPNNFNVINTNVEIGEDRFDTNSAGLFGEEKYLRIDNNELLKPQFPISLSFWVKQEETGINRNYIYTSDLQLDKRAGFAIAFSTVDNRLLFFYSDENGCYNPSCRRTFTSVDPIESGDWKHISIVVKSENDAHFSYILLVLNG